MRNAALYVLLASTLTLPVVLLIRSYMNNIDCNDPVSVSARGEMGAEICAK